MHSFRFSILSILGLLSSFTHIIISADGQNLDDYDYTASGNDIKIYDFGMRNFKSSDVAYLFYVDILNVGAQPVIVGLEKDKCCHIISQDDVDCESMTLTSGLHVQLYPGEKRNLTTFYINGYLLDRIGYCGIKVQYHHPQSPGKFFDGGRVTIHFDTTLPSSSILLKLISIFKKFNFYPYTKCQYVDLDPQKDCTPVNCLLKYNGLRSFYNKTSFQCEPTPQCSELEVLKKMGKLFKPTQMLSPISNKCIKIKPSVNFDESLLTLREVEDPIKSYTAFPLKVECVNGGNGSNDGGFINCTCDAGWTSLPINNKTFDPTKDVLTLCNIRSNNGQQNDEVGTASSSFVLLFVIIIILILLICICIPYICRKFNKKSFDKASSTCKTTPRIESEPIISCIKNRREVRLPPPGPIPTKSEILTSCQAEKSKHVCIQPTRPDQKPKPMYLRFHDDLNCNEGQRPKTCLNFEICQSSYNNFPCLTTEENLSSPGSCMSLQRMGSSDWNCCDNSLLEPLLKINILPPADQGCCSERMDRNAPNIEIRTQGIYIPDSCCINEPICDYYPARESEYRKKRVEWLERALGTPSHTTRAEPHGLDVEESAAENQNGSRAVIPKSWASQFWDSNKN